MSDSIQAIVIHDSRDDFTFLDGARQALRVCPVEHPDRSNLLEDLATAVMTRFEWLDDLDSLAEAVELHRQALDLRQPGHPDRSVSLNNLANTLKTRFERLRDFDSLADAVDMHREALDLRPPGHPDRFTSLSNLTGAVLARFEQLRDLDSLAEAVDLQREALDLLPSGHPDRSRSLNNMAIVLVTQYKQLGDLALLAEAVELYRQALNLRPPGHPDRVASLNNLANAVWTQSEQLGDLDLLAKAVELHREVLDMRPPGHPNRSMSLNNMANALMSRFEQLGNLASLTEAVEMYRQALDLHPPGHPEHLTSLGNLASAVNTRFDQLGDLDSLAEAIELHRQALGLCPPGHPHCSASLGSLGNAMLTRFEQLGDLHSLAQAIELHRQALDLRPPGHPHRSVTLNSLAGALQSRFEQLGDIDSLAEIVDLHREALDLRPPGHPKRRTSLNNLARIVMTRFEHLGDLGSLAEAVSLYREALDLYPRGHPHRSKVLNNLANAMHTRFEQLGDLDALAEVVSLHRETLDLRPPGHPHRPMSLSNLASAVMTRFEHLGDLDSLAEVVNLYREALDVLPPGHPHRPKVLNNLAIAVRTRVTQVCDPDALAEAVYLHREALNLSPPGHPYRATSLSDMASALLAQFEQLGDLDSLAEAINLHREALVLRPRGHFNRSVSLSSLAHALKIQIEYVGNIDNDRTPKFRNQALVSVLNEELDLNMEGLSSCTDEHPMRMRFLFAVGNCLLRTGTHIFDFQDGVRHILEALRNPSSPARHCLSHAIGALGMVEAAYQASAEHQDTPDLGPNHYDNLVLQVYMQTIRLLPRAASFGLNHVDRLHELAGTEAISRDAGTRAMAVGRDAEAVEMLEEGRGVFWSQALRLRATELDLLPPEDASQVRRLFQTLNPGSECGESMSTVQREQHIERRRQLSNAAETLIADIRSRPGMSRFLLPPAFSSLVQSLPHKGFVVFLVASELGHNALVLNRAEARAVSIALVPPKGGSFSCAFRAALPRDGGSQVASHDAIDVSRMFGVSGKKSKTSHKKIEEMLAFMWTSIVKPVIDILRLMKATGLDRPRVWWCATGEFSFLPVHAAGITRDGVVEFASDYFVSSYIPTLSALAKSRADWCPVPCNQVTGVLAACKNAPHQAPLNNVEREIEMTMACFKQASAQVLLSSFPNTTSQLLRKHLLETGAHVLHLACHGEQAESPLDSAFLLSDGMLSIQDLMTIHLTSGVLAFLSACQTARGSERQPDQAVHLAASMLFCGFRSVVGTMWVMNDEDGPDVAHWFYESLFAEEHLDLDQIPYALDEAVTKLREKGVPASQWALFIHIGG